MNKQARQWPLKTAGLQPVQLVHNHQLGHLTLKFSIKYELQDGLIEPLMSPAFWKNRMGNIRQVALNTFIWSISGLASVVIKYDKEQREICVKVTFRVDADKIDTTGRFLALVGEALESQISTFDEDLLPPLEYTFQEDEAGSRSFSKTKGG